jgi:nucleoside-diphosphate-sugar epimerase
MQRVLVTGSAGRIGRRVRAGLAAPDRPLRLLDIADQDPPRPGEPVELVRADLADPEAVRRACAGVDAILHLGAIPAEAGWDDLMRNNVEGTRNVLEAAREAGIARIVLASSVHAAGFYHRPGTDPRAPGLAVPAGPDGVPAARPARPDTYYGWTKAALEALGSLFADRFGMTVFALRLGAFTDRPEHVLELDIWLAPDDGIRLFAACLDAEVTGFHVLWGVSANPGRWLSIAEANAVGYVPCDGSGRFAEAAMPDESGTGVWLGGSYTTQPLGDRT